jgi:hypothetical protein
MTDHRGQLFYNSLSFLLFLLLLFKKSRDCQNKPDTGLEYHIHESWDTSVGIAVGCGLDSRGLILGRGKIFLYPIKSPDQL